MILCLCLIMLSPESKHEYFMLSKSYIVLCVVLKNSLSMYQNLKSYDSELFLVLCEGERSFYCLHETEN